MSGDVQPRKRKDKKKKKDDLGIEEPRGTAAALGEGDIFMHSHHEHGTGGHWCAKVIFFSLLAVLVTLIGLIILENRGLSELEANSVESRYSGVLEGWLEDGHDDDHHDEHTLELKHHDDEDDDDHDDALDPDEDDDDEHDHGDEDDDHDDDDEEQSHEADEDEDDEANQDNDEEQTQEDDEDDEQNEDEHDETHENDDEDDDNAQQADDDENEEILETADDEDEIEEKSYRRYYRNTDNKLKNYDGEDDDDDFDKNDDDDDKNQSEEKDIGIQNDGQENDDEQENNNDSQENDDEVDDDAEDNDDELEQPITNDDEDNEQDEDEEDHDDHNDHEDDPEVELEHIEEEIFDEDVSTEATAPARKEPVRNLREESEEDSKEPAPLADDDDDDDEVEQLEPGDADVDDLPEELPIPVPKGRPLVEVEDSPSTEKPHDTLAEEEEYERQQEALRKEKEEASQGMWLKLVVGGALLVATQAVLRRATAPRESDEVETSREATPLADRRMTIISDPVPPPSVSPKPQEVPRPVIEKEIVRQAPVFKSPPPPPPDDEEEELEVEEEEGIVVEKEDEKAAKRDKELYSDEEEDAEDEEEEEEEVEPPKLIAPIKEPPKPVISKPIYPTPSKTPVKESPEKKEPPKVVEKEPTPEDEEDDDVEIIEEEDIGEDFEDEEEEISDVDDAELLSRLEAKYGRLPAPERPGKQSKQEGGNSIEDEWPGEPSDAYWRDELDNAERDLRQGEWMNAAKRASAAELRPSARARFLVARAYDMLAEAKRDNGLLSKAIAAYLELLKMNEKLSNKKLIEVSERTLDRMKFRGSYISTEPIYRLLIRRFPNDPTHRNNLTISFLMANRMDLAEDVIKETLKQWPNDRIALANHGFILKTLHKDYEKAVVAFSKALEGDTGPANEPRYYYHLGDSLLLLGRKEEAHEVHKRGAKLGHFLSPVQRSLYNVDRLKSQPWWDVMKTPYARLAKALEKSWKEILKEGRAAQALYEEEKEGLREKGEWSQLDLFARGREVAGRCARAPITCGIVLSEPGASGCRRGQVKFSLMEPGTHVRAHVGPTNCRLRMHLGLSNTKDTYIRVDKETRQWQTGKVLMFDDSFEHEVWHNGTGARLVLIVDVWHPDLTRAEILQLPSI